MKTHIKYPILFALAFALCNSACSQRLTVSTGINVGVPVSYTYYYYPDYEVYYRVETGTWFIRRNFIWTTYTYLPAEYYFIHNRGYRRVSLPYHGSKHPFAYHNKFRSSYPKNNKAAKPHNNKVDYKMKTLWKSEKPSPMKTTISNKPKSGGAGNKGGGHKGQRGRGKKK